MFESVQGTSRQTIPRSENLIDMGVGDTFWKTANPREIQELDYFTTNPHK